MADDYLSFLIDSSIKGSNLAINLRDNTLSEALIGNDIYQTQNLLKYLLHDKEINKNKFRIKPKYLINNSRSYNYLIAKGCPQCSKDIDFTIPSQIIEDNKIKCSDCDFGIAPLITENDEEEDAVYLYGSRDSFVYDRKDKNLWKKFSHKTDISLLEMANSSLPNATQIVKEKCLKCGSPEQYYSTFQARSADEGMTIIYECVSCGNRTSFNV